MRQRRGASEAGDGSQDGYDAKKKPPVSDRTLLIGMGSLVLGMPLVVALIIKVAHPQQDLSKLAEKPKMHHGLEQGEVREHLRNHTMLHIGGLHRSGTTVLWDGLRKHPDVSALEHQDHTDKRVATWINRVFSEGIFLQRVYPKFGLDHDKFMLRKWIGQFFKKIPFVDETIVPWVRLREGVGRFALDPKHHLDESSPLVNDLAQKALFNQWAIFWDLKKPVLIEKSPSNVVISPFLHRLWGLGLEDGASPAKFIFMRRHPIAVALATMRAGGATVSDLSAADLVENWVMAEERLATDLSQYFEARPTDGKTYRILTMEAMLKAPKRTFEDLVAWLGLPASKEASADFAASAKKDPNAKYFRHYCLGMMSGKRQEGRLKEHAALVRKWGARVKAIEPSYDLEAFIEICRHTLIGKPKDADGPSEEELEAEEAAMQAEGLK